MVADGVTALVADRAGERVQMALGRLLGTAHRAAALGTRDGDRAGFLLGRQTMGEQLAGELASLRLGLLLDVVEGLPGGGSRSTHELIVELPGLAEELLTARVVSRHRVVLSSAEACRSTGPG